MRAVVDSELLRVPVAEFHEIVGQRPAFMLEFTRLICSRYKSALQWIDSTTLQPFPVRLAQRLLTAQRVLSSSSAAETNVLRLSQEDLGHMLGISRQSVNKQLKAWEAQYSAARVWSYHVVGYRRIGVLGAGNVG
ncbi:Crp/Fnr family transcriptional regulator (plasmid) [Polaromonas sp. P1-6]|nr:Crp/Fnr family transcriptional regulator [Polaromonas sp. P1-6]